VNFEQELGAQIVLIGDEPHAAAGGGDRVQRQGNRAAARIVAVGAAEELLRLRMSE